MTAPSIHTEQPTPPLGARAWLYAGVSVLMSIRAHLWVSNPFDVPIVENVTASLVLFLPILGGWLGAKYGHAALTPLLIAAPLVIPAWGWFPTPSTNALENDVVRLDGLVIYAGMEIWLLTLAAAVMFADPERGSSRPIMTRRSLFWLAASPLLVTQVAISVRPTPETAVTLATWPELALTIAAFLLTATGMTNLRTTLLAISAVLVAMLAVGVSLERPLVASWHAGRFAASIGIALAAPAYAGATLAAALAGFAFRRVLRTRPVAPLRVDAAVALIAAGAALIVAPIAILAAAVYARYGVNVFVDHQNFALNLSISLAVMLAGAAITLAFGALRENRSPFWIPATYLAGALIYVSVIDSMQDTTYWPRWVPELIAFAVVGLIYAWCGARSARTVTRRPPAAEPTSAA